MAHISQGPSVFPILFAAVLGRAARYIFSWRLEKGARIGTLDLLADSTSLTATVISQFRLRMLNFFGLGLIIIWAWSPVGGQASFRQMTIGSKITSQSSAFNYMTHSGNLSNFDYSDRASSWAIVNTLYVASLIAPANTKTSPRDTWGNIKIPMIEHYESSSSADNSGWYETEDGTNSTNSGTYSSLVGIPVMGTNSSDYINYAFNTEAEYLHLECSAINSPATNFSFNSTSGSYVYGSLIVPDPDSALGRWTLDPYANNRTSFSFTYFTYLNFSVSNCSIETTYVEVEVACATELTCGASRIRRSRLQHPPPAFTKLDLRTGSMVTPNWDLFSSGFATAIQGHPQTVTVAEVYLIDPLNPIEVFSHVFVIGTNLTQRVSNEDYELHLNQLMNTYWTSMNGMYAVSAGLSADTANLKQQVSETSRILASVSTTDGTKSIQTPVIEAHVGWVIALAIASSIMIVASLVPPVVRIWITQGPETMLNISSLVTRNNHYLPLPTNGTFLDASERARLLKDVNVRFGDIDGAANIGRLVIGTSRNLPITGLVKGRMYQ